MFALKSYFFFKNHKIFLIVLFKRFFLLFLLINLDPLKNFRVVPPPPKLGFSSPLKESNLSSPPTNKPYPPMGGAARGEGMLGKSRVRRGGWGA